MSGARRERGILIGLALWVREVSFIGKTLKRGWCPRRDTIALGLGTLGEVMERDSPQQRALDRCAGSTLTVGAFLLTLVACTGASSDRSDGGGTSVVPPTNSLTVTEILSPSGPGSGEPSLYAAEDGAVWMSWIEATANGHAVRYARLQGETWSPKMTLLERDDLFVNWADFPTLVALGDDALAFHWLQKSGGGSPYAYDVWMRMSPDQGANWGEPFQPHRDGTFTEHGFVSMVPETDGGYTAVWLDGRQFAVAEDKGDVSLREMTLRSARIGPDGRLSDERILDPRICDCCQTSAARMGDALVIAYRDRSPEDIRDIWVARRGPEGWEKPRLLAADEWQIPGCPVNGPAVAGSGDHGAIAWFALRQERPEIKVALSKDAGASFGKPVVVAVPHGSEDVPLGRVDVAWVDERMVAVSWLTDVGSGAEIRLRTVSLDGMAGSVRVVAHTDSARSSGFPRMVRARDRLIFAWTEPGAPAVIHTAVSPLPMELWVSDGGG